MEPQKQRQLRFWTGFTGYVRSEHPELPDRAPRPVPEMWYAAGRAKTHVTPIIKNDGIRVALWLRDNDRVEVFRRLAADKSAIQREIGARLTWEERAGRPQSVVKIERIADLRDERTWPECYAWLAEYVSAFLRVFGARLG